MTTSSTAARDGVRNHCLTECDAAVSGRHLPISSRDVTGGQHLQEAVDQQIVLEAWQDKEKVHILSCDKARSRWQKILIDTTKGEEKIHIWGLNGTQELLVDSTAGAEKIQLTDKAGQIVVMDAAGGKEKTKATDKAGSVLFMDGVMGNIIIRSANKVLINP